MNGILNILKPPGMTSFDVVAHMRGLLGIRKIGHAGTLDPLAAGVLPVCCGRATKAIEFLMDKDKIYRGELTLGVTTDTQDSSGQVLKTMMPQCSDKEIEDAVKSFEGTYFQVPPMYSALRVNGKRLYDLARKGIEVDRPSREITVHSIKVINIDRDDGIKVIFDVHCSKGTYIRTLCQDIGERLGCGAHMSFLLRKRAGPFDISEAHTLEDLAEMQKAGRLQSALRNVDILFSTLPAVRLDEQSEKRFRNGVVIPIDTDKPGFDVTDKKKLVGVYGEKGVFLALAFVIDKGNDLYLKVKKFF
jgi:tRNA pseudouridine55 synthase